MNCRKIRELRWFHSSNPIQHTRHSSSVRNPDRRISSHQARETRQSLENGSYSVCCWRHIFRMSSNFWRCLHRDLYSSNRAPEIFAVYCTAFVIIGSVIGASSMRGLISTVFGILLSIIGLDPISSLPRLTFEINMLEIGKGLVPVL